MPLGYNEKDNVTITHILLNSGAVAYLNNVE